MMLQFLYTAQLPEGIQLSEGLDLYHVADFALIPSLQQATLQHMAVVPFADLGQQDQRLLLSAMHTLIAMAGTQPDDPCGQVAAALKEGVVKYLIQNFWQDPANTEVWEGLPQECVVEVLSHNDLAVRAENTAAVAAVSWLRGEQGLLLKEPAADEAARTKERHQKRKEVLEAVRLLRLEPWFFSWQLFDVPEAAELLDGKVLRMLSQYQGYSEGGTGRQLLREEAEQFVRWATPRQGARLAPATASISWKKEDVLKAISDLRAGSTYIVPQHGETVFSSGLDWKLSLRLARAAGQEEGTIRLWGGVYATLGAGSAAAGGQDIAKWPCSMTCKWGRSTAITISSAAAAALGDGCGNVHLISSHSTATEPMLKEVLDGENVVLAVTLSSLT